MAIVTIKNDTCTAQVDTMGAQLLSMRFDDREYLWQRDERWWGRTSPILFPIVGNIRNGEVMSEQGLCHMKQHGVARNYEHRVVDVAADGTSVTFELCDSSETREQYPYAFRLNMTYALVGEATLAQTFSVTNTGSVTLPFSVGGHPAFNIPVEGTNEAFDEYDFTFAEPWHAECPKIVEGGLADPTDTFVVLDGGDTLPLTRSCFDYDTMVFNHVPGNTVSLTGRRSGHGVRVDFPGFDYLGVWSMAPDAPFVAIEPWTGHATLTTEDDVLEHKEGITLLAPGATDKRTFTITAF